jgi:hypothetical protein
MATTNTIPTTTITIPNQHVRSDYERVAVAPEANRPSGNPPSETAVAAGRTDTFTRSTYEWTSLLGGTGAKR